MKLLITLILCVSAMASPKPPTITQSQLDKMLHYWQHVLKLDDWDMQVRLVKIDDLPKGTAGYSDVNSSRRFMFITALTPEDYSKLSELDKTQAKVGREIILDIEDTIIHELVHLRLHELTKLVEDDDEHKVEETTVTRLTSALLASHKR